MDKIEQLRFRLMSAGVDTATTNDIIETALARVESRMVHTIDSGANLAFEESLKVRAKAFGEDMRVGFSNRGLEIQSAKGSLDYSSPPFPMLSRLLAKGKTAKDGSTYRVIPMGAGSTKTTGRLDTSVATTALSDTQPKKSLTEMTRQMAAAFNSGMKVTTQETKSSSNATSFRVASSKQDPGSSWVIPARQADLSSAVGDINAMMASDLDRAIDDVLEDMEREIRDAIYNA